MPMMILSMVVLPAPLGPTSASARPGDLEGRAAKEDACAEAFFDLVDQEG